MTLAAFIRANRDEIDRRIQRLDVTVSSMRKMTDADRRTWILAEETLYDWARQNGVTKASM